MSSKRILVIDDEVAVLEVVQSCFEDVAGWQVILARSGQEGLAKAVSEKPDAIALDVIIPDMNGIAVLQHLKANPATAAIPVVLLTIAVDFMEPNACAAVGAVGAIAKPFDPIHLVEEMARYLGWTLDQREQES
ncbi:MAG: response regulator [Leptolyngbyaceae cyanobacterium bins.302]|nr:response regulator [Leptolyngbyaceae cyanobacterium bins.302]